jgi:hypothetical protein
VARGSGGSFPREAAAPNRNRSSRSYRGIFAPLPRLSSRGRLTTRSWRRHRQNNGFPLRHTPTHRWHHPNYEGSTFLVFAGLSVEIIRVSGSGEVGSIDNFELTLRLPKPSPSWSLERLPGGEASLNRSRLSPQRDYPNLESEAKLGSPCRETIERSAHQQFHFVSVKI